MKTISFQESCTFLLAHSATADQQFSKPKRSSYFSIAFSTSDKKNGWKIVLSLETQTVCICNLTKNLRVPNLLPRVSTAGKNTLVYLQFPLPISESRTFFTAAAFSWFLKVSLQPLECDHVSKLLTINKHKIQNLSQKKR